MKLSKKYTNIIKDVVNETVNTQYLYHAMWKSQYKHCKKENKLYGHKDGEVYNGYNKKGYTNTRELYGISTSRNIQVCINFMENQIKEFQNDWKENSNIRFNVKNPDSNYSVGINDDLSFVVLVLDYNKIKQKHKIIPHSYLAGKMKSSFGDEQEELIIGDLENLDNYVVDVIEFNNNINKNTLKSQNLNEAFVKNPFSNEVLCYYSKLESEVKQIIKNKFNDIPVRVLYDFVNKVYIFGNANTLIHVDLIDKMKQYGKTDFGYRYPIKEEEQYKWMDKNCAMFKIINTNDYKSYTRSDGYKMGVIGKLDTDMYVILRDNTLAMERSKITGNFVPDELQKCKKVPMLQNVKFVKYDIRDIGMFTSKEQLPQKLVNEAFNPKLNDNFWKWFGNSKVVDENGNPLVVYHGSGHNNIESFDASRGTNINAIYFSNKENVAIHYSPSSYLKRKTFLNTENVYDEIEKINDVDKLLSILNIYTNVEIKKYSENNWRLDEKGEFESSAPLGKRIDDHTFVSGDGKVRDLIKILKRKIIDEVHYSKNATVYPCYLSIQYPLIVDAQSKPYWKIDFNGEKVNTETIADYALNNGYDGVIIYNVYETNYETVLCNDYIVFNPNQIKSVDNNGNWSLKSNNINESVRPQYLYHSTWKRNYENILNQNKIIGQPITLSNNKNIKGVSVSRNKNVCKNLMNYRINNNYSDFEDNEDMLFYDGNGNEYYDSKDNLTYYILIFDYDKLNQDKKIIPHSYHQSGRNGEYDDEQEEIIVGDLNNVKKYLIDVEEVKYNKTLNESASYGGANWQNNMDALGNVPATIGHNLFMTMFPYHFLSLCPKYNYGDDKFFDDYIESKKPIGIPFLIVDFNFDTKTIEVQDHEGRHRVAAISRRKNGNIVDIPVALLYSKNKYPQIPSIEELRKNWTIVSQKGDKEYNVGQFSVYNSFPKSISDKWFNLYESLQKYEQKYGAPLYVTNNPYDVIKLSKKYTSIRVNVDDNKNLYIIQSSKYGLHSNMYYDAITQGYYDFNIINDDGSINSVNYQKQRDYFNNNILNILIDKDERYKNDRILDSYKCKKIENGILYYRNDKFKNTKLYKILTSDVNNLYESKENYQFEDTVIDMYGEEKFKKLILLIDNKEVGYIKYSEYEETPYIQYIFVKEQYRRKGYGKKMVAKLQMLYPNAEIHFGMMTDDGSKLYKSLNKDIIVNKDYDKKVRHLEKINQWLKKYGSITQKDIEDWTDDDIKYIRKYADIWQKYHNKQQDIEDWLNNNKRETIKIKYNLNEGIEEIKKYFPKIDSQKINELVRLDPTYKGGNELGKYGKWILNLYNNFLKDKIAFQKWEEQKKLGNNYPEPIRKSQEQIEDFEKLPAILKDFDIMNNKLKVNINNVKSIAELYKIVNDAKNQGISTNSQVNKGLNLIKKSVSKGGKVVFKDSNWIVLVPETLESSCVFGDDTNWCTTSPNGDMYNYYKDKDGGQYFINLNLQTGELYQFHFESEQFMDKNDNEIQIEQIIGNDIKLKKFYLNYLYENYKLYKNLAYFILILDENPSEQFQLAAVKQNRYAIEYINNPSEQVQLEAVKQDGWIIRFINNPSEQVQLAAVKQNGKIIEYIDNPTEQVQLAAVKQEGRAIQYIDNPSEKVQLEAVKQNGHAIQYINNPSDKVKALYKKLYRKINESSQLNENKFSDILLDIQEILSQKNYTFNIIPNEYTIYIKYNTMENINGIIKTISQKKEFNFVNNETKFIKLCKSLYTRFTGIRIPNYTPPKKIFNMIDNYNNESISQEAVVTILNSYYSKIIPNISNYVRKMRL